MFEPFDTLRILSEIPVLIGEHLLEFASGRGDVNRHLDKEIKILFFFWEKIQETHRKLSTPETGFDSKTSEYSLEVLDCLCGRNCRGVPPWAPPYRATSDAHGGTPLHK